MQAGMRTGQTHLETWLTFFPPSSYAVNMSAIESIIKF